MENTKNSNRNSDYSVVLSAKEHAEKLSDTVFKANLVDGKLHGEIPKAICKEVVRKSTYMEYGVLKIDMSNYIYILIPYRPKDSGRYIDYIFRYRIFKDSDLNKEKNLSLFVVEYPKETLLDKFKKLDRLEYAKSRVDKANVYQYLNFRYTLSTSKAKKNYENIPAFEYRGDVKVLNSLRAIAMLAGPRKTFGEVLLNRLNLGLTDALIDTQKRIINSPGDLNYEETKAILDKIYSYINHLYDTANPSDYSNYETI